MRKIWTAGLFLGVFIFARAAYAADEEKVAPCRVAYPSDDAVQWESHVLTGNESLESLFGDRWQDVARFNRIDRRHARPGTCLKIPLDLDDIEGFSPLPVRLDYPGIPEERKFILIDLSEQFLGAYENGGLVFSSPVASGKSDFITPPGEFRVTAFSRWHVSSLYRIEEKDVPYPMHFALRFLTADDGVSYWIHGRDLPGYPASHGCVGLYDEDMQKEYYGFPEYPLVNSARKLYEWAIAPNDDKGDVQTLENGPRVLIIGEPPGGAGSRSNPAPGP